MDIESEVSSGDEPGVVGELETAVADKADRGFDDGDHRSAVDREDPNSTAFDKLLLVVTLVVFVIVFRDNQAMEQTDRNQRRHMIEWIVSSAALAWHIQLLLSLLFLVPSRAARALVAAADMTLVVATLASGLYQAEMSHHPVEKRHAERLNSIRIFLDMVALQLVVVVAVRSRHHLLLAVATPARDRSKSASGHVGIPLFSLGLLSMFWLAVSLWFLWEWQEARTSWSHDLFGRELQNRAEMFCQVRTGGPLGFPQLSLRPHQSFDVLSETFACGRRPFYSHLRNGVFHMDCHLQPALVIEYSSERPGSPMQQLKASRSVEYAGKPVSSTSSIIRAQCGPHKNFHLQVKSDDALVEKTKRRWLSRMRNVHTRAESRDSRQSGYNVLVLVVESVSRLQFYRRFRQTSAALRRLRQSKYTNLYQFVRYTMPYCGDKTGGPAVIGGCHYEWSNAWSVREGKDRSFMDENKESPTKAQHEKKSKKVPPKERLLCKHSNLMAEAHLAGYLTALAGESCQSDYLDVGRSMNNGHASESFTSVRSHVDVNFTSLLCHPDMLSSKSQMEHCLHHRPSPSYVGDLAETFLDAYNRKVSFFATFQFLNGQETTGLVARVQDRAVAQVLNKVARQQMLSRTIVLLYSEHSLYNTLDVYQKSHGDHVELLNPAAFLLLPESYIHRFPEVDEALLDNEQSLVTPYDLHATLSDLMFPHATVNSSGVTLLRPIPRSRTCRQAGIPRHLCPCIRDA